MRQLLLPIEHAIRLLLNRLDILDQDGSVSNRVVLHGLDSLGCIFHLQDVDPRLDLFVGSQLQHSNSLLFASDMRRGQSGSVTGKSLRGDVGQTLLWHTDKYELLFNVKSGQKLVDGEFGGRGSDDDQVEFEGEILVETLGGSDESLGTHLEGVLLFSIGSREYCDLCAESDTKQDGVVTPAKSTTRLGMSCLTHNPPRPTTPTFFPGPAPFRTKGEKTVKPPHNIEAASTEGKSSGMGKTNRS